MDDDYIPDIGDLLRDIRDLGDRRLQLSDARKRYLECCPYPEFLKTPEWRECRRVVLEAADRWCRCCGDVATQVHHAYGYKRFGRLPPRELWSRVLWPLCASCHRDQHPEKKHYLDYTG